MVRRPARVAVTGLGVVSALGVGADSTFRRVVAGEVGIGPVTAFDVADLRCRVAAEARGLAVADVAPAGEADAWSRSDALAVVAAREALSHAGLATELLPVSVVVGGTTGGMLEAEEELARYSGDLSAEAARRLLAYPLSTSAERIAQTLGRVERTATVCSACSSSANAIALGAAWIAGGRAERVLAGGTDALCRLTFVGFSSLGVMAAGACRPFDAERDGLSLGEAGAFLLLESQDSAARRGAQVLAWLAGWASASEAHHITHPEPSGRTAVSLIRGALAQAGLTAAELDYVNAHGTATQQNDETEARALAEALGPELDRVRVSSSKGQLGHTLGAAGALEAAITVSAIQRQICPPTGGLSEPDPRLALRHVRERGEPTALRAALSSSFGFGGAGTVLAFERADSPARVTSCSERGLVVTGASSLGARGILGGAATAEHAEPGAPTEIVQDPLSALDPTRSRRFDRAAALVTLGVERALASAKLAPRDVGLVVGSAFGNVERSVEFLRRILVRGPRFASPAEFPQLVPSAPPANASIYLGLTGPVLGVADLGTSAEVALCVAASWLEVDSCRAMVAGCVEPQDGIVERVLTPIHGGEVAAAGCGDFAAWLVLEPAREAEQRGAAPLARLIGWQQLRGCWSLPPPRGAGAIVVLGAPDDPAIEQALRGTAWSGAPRRPIDRAGVPPRARGAAALVTAVGLISSGLVPEALVVARERERNFAFHFLGGVA